MASQRGRTREEEGRLSLRTLVIASAASAAAAIVVSQFWIRGTPIAAAVTPVIVALVSEMLHRPTQVVARKLTTERTAIMPEAMGAGPPQEEPVEEPPTIARDLEAEGGPVRVYKPERRTRRIHPKVIAITAVLAFAIAAVVLTVPELIAGGSIGKRDGGTTLLGGGRDRDRNDDQEDRVPADQQEEVAPEEEQPEEAPADPAEEAPPPEATTPEEEPLPTTTTPTVPEAPVQP